uniref:CX domain-containing protein n=1 Tax=Elaeophora elaphi TaxID=1147741 RepID=A0A158Q6P3_9BILA
NNNNNEGRKSGNVSLKVYSLASLVLFGWQLDVINSCQTVTMSQANLQCEYWCPCVGASNQRTSALIQGRVYCIVQLALFSWQSYAIKYYRDIAANQLIPGHNTYAAYNIPTYFENYYDTSQTIFYTDLPLRKWNIEFEIYGFIQLAVFGWQMAAIKYEKDRAADTILPNYNEYGRLDIPTYYESYWQSPEERFYIGSHYFSNTYQLRAEASFCHDHRRKFAAKSNDRRSIGRSPLFIRYSNIVLDCVIFPAVCFLLTHLWCSYCKKSSFTDHNSGMAQA